MPYARLASVKHRLVAGKPLPFDIHDFDYTLLFARGHIVGSIDQIDALVARGLLVDVDDLHAAHDGVKDAPAARLPQLWSQAMDHIGSTLLEFTQEGFDQSLDKVSAPLHSLIERDPDLAIFQMVRQHGNVHTMYGVRHSIHTAIAAFLVARRLGWPVSAVHKVFKVALTMNLSMLELQGQMAEQRTPLTDRQRAALLSHPKRSVQMLELAGIRDAEWLAGVADHHVAADGSGYPAGRHDINDLAALVHRADIYTAMLSPRATRAAMPADRVSRSMFVRDPGNAMTAALVKEFGVYPPGCFVELVSGETAVVLKRGASVFTPRVAALTTGSGVALREPVPRDCADPAFAVAVVVAESAVGTLIRPEKLMALML